MMMAFCYSPLRQSEFEVFKLSKSKVANGCFYLKKKKKSDRDTSDKTHLLCPLKSVAEIWLIIEIWTLIIKNTT